MIELTLKRQISLIVVIVATAAPTILVAVLASFYYYLGVESFFNEKVSKAISETVNVAHLYLEEHKDNIKTDIYSTANILEKNRQIVLENPSLLPLLLDKQSNLLNLSEVAIFNREKVIARNTLGFSLIFEKVPMQDIQAADDSMEAVLLKSGTDDRVRAIMRLPHFIEGTYLLIGKYIDPEIINHLKETSDSAAQYSILWGNIKFTRNKLIALFIVVSAILCLTAIFISNRLSNFIVNPLIKLVDATKLIKDGNFTTRVPENRTLQEIQTLAKAFNSMIEQISMQRAELIRANNLIDKRRRFIETILIELSSGVLVLNPEYNITLYNHVVYKLLRINEEKSILSLKIEEIFPEISKMLSSEKFMSTGHIEEHLVVRRYGHVNNILLRVGIVKDSKEKLESIIITMADITELVVAQKAAAWTEIAKRIAHEVKNPLTPIQLAAERLKKKYSSQISHDNETFLRYIDTIIRHVSDIETMLSEFLNFARTPAPKFALCELSNVIKDIVFSQNNVFRSIKYIMNFKDKEWIAYCDRAQISQVLTNLLKNAAESIEVKTLIAEKSFCGEITILLSEAEFTEIGKFIIVSICDNGLGIDKSIIDRITEPYVTTKTTGTGLGLAIVQRLVMDNGGRFSIRNTVNGVCAELYLHVTPFNTYS